MCGRNQKTTSVQHGSPAKLLVFVHGGAHTGRCWEETIYAITKLRPDIDALAVDLPGRRGIPGDLASLNIDACVSSVSDQVLQRLPAADDCPLVIVGHSVAGVILAGLVNRLGAHRVKQVIFVACCVPAAGQCVIDTLPFGLKAIARRLVNRSPVINAVPFIVLRFFLGTSATRRQREGIRANFCPESSALLTEVRVARFPNSVHTSWVLPSRDRALRPSVQRKFIDNVGGVDELVIIDAGHEVMLTHPQELATNIARLALDGSRV